MFAVLCAVLVAGTELRAQPEGEEPQPGGGSQLPRLDIPTITVVSTRRVVLPSARKGEVLDTVIYVLGGVDSLIFGNRISYLHGDGGQLPSYDEFIVPFSGNAEASVGTYISPHGRIALGYAERSWNGRALLDLRMTNGHVDSAEASSILLNLGGEYLFPGDLPTPGRGRVGAEVDYLNDGYILYGTPSYAADRTRASGGLALYLQSETGVGYDYRLDVMVSGASVSDELSGGDTVYSYGATAPDVAFRIGFGDTLRFNAHARYRSTSVDYPVPPSYNVGFYELGGDLEWAPSPGLFLSAGGFFAGGDYSDSGSTSLVMVRGAARYAVNGNLSLFARFAPELRAPSFRDRMMQAPYAMASVPLRPERVPIALAGGVRLGVGPASIEAEAFYEQGENTPVVTLVGGTGILGWALLDSRSMGLRGNVRVAIDERMSLTGDLTIVDALIDSTDEQLPMTPALDARARLDFAFSDRIGIFGTLTFQSEQRVAVDDATLPAGVDPEIGARFLLGGGASYGIGDRIQIFGEVSNLLNQDYELWSGYEAPGIELRGGIRYEL